MMKLWGLQSTPSLTPFPDLLRPGMVVPNRFVYMGQIEINCVPILN